MSLPGKYSAAFLLTSLLASTTALAGTFSDTVSDPFSTAHKAKTWVMPNLKADNCSGTTDFARKLTFSDVVITSLCNNPATRAAYLSLLSQAATYGTNYAGYLPNASATASLTRGTTFASGSKSTFIDRSSGLSVGMTLYDFGQREFKLEAAEQGLVAAAHSYSSTLQGTIAGAMKGYYQLLTAQNALIASREAERFAKESYDAAVLRHKIGQVALADELQAKGSYSQAMLSTQQAQNQLSQSQASLAALMGTGADTPVAVAEMDDKTLTQDPFGGKVKELMEEAKQKRVDLKASRAQIESSELSLKALKRSDLATLSAGVNAGRTQGSTIDPFRNGATRDQSVGLSVSIPIFTGFSQTYSEHAAEKSLEAQREQLAQSELGVEQDVWNSWHNYATAKQSWQTSNDLLASSTQLKDVTLGRYKAGLGSILDVLNAQSQYSSALQSHLQSRYNLLTARLDLVRAVGVLDLDSMRPEITLSPAPETTEPGPMLD